MVESEAGRAAGAELLGRYQRAVYLWCYRYVRDHERALDMSQEVLLRAWRALDSFGGKSKFSTWLFAIARNRCLNEMHRVSLFEEGEADFDTVQAPNPDPVRRLEEREYEERIYTLIRTTLEPEEQRAIWLRCFERMPIDEITWVLGIESASGARGLLQKARRKLRNALKESGDE
ncbi:MAG: sigma-70 family RNA polymerase sigma factor [bacterium]|nr:MAG: sigma-70 family RNA polymerase sigma factor [bacterium]